MNATKQISFRVFLTAFSLITGLSLAISIACLFYYNYRELGENSIQTTLRTELEYSRSLLIERIQDRKANLADWIDSSALNVALEFNRPEGLKNYLEHAISRHGDVLCAQVFWKSGLFVQAGCSVTASSASIFSENIKFDTETHEIELTTHILRKKHSAVIRVTLASNFSNSIFDQFHKRMQGHGLSDASLALTNPGTFKENPSIYRDCLSVQIGRQQYLCAAAPLSQMRSYQSRAITLSASIGALFAFLFLIITLFAYSGLSRFLSRLISDLSALSSSQKPTSDAPSRFREFAVATREMERIFGILKQKREQDTALSRSVALNEVSVQVAHDIRSPLAALDMVFGHLDSLPEELRQIARVATGRIRDIANNLLKASRAKIAEAEERHQVLLVSLIEELITEKRTEFRDKTSISIEFASAREGYGIFSTVKAHELKRVLSNLINNSVESIAGSGRIELTLTSGPASLNLNVADSGKGISPEVLSHLTGAGGTYGKTDGTGLGLSHARNTALAYGGELIIKSQIGNGTTVTIVLPRATPPFWYVSALIVPDTFTVIAIDDDASIHGVWKERMPDSSLHHFSDPSHFKAWWANHPEVWSDALILVDYEFIGSSMTGINLIETVGIAEQSVLVTSRYDEPKIQEACFRLGVKIIPKWAAGLIPIQLGH